MAPVAGLAPLAGPFGFIDPSPELTPEQQQGDTADPRHGQSLAGQPVRHLWEVLPGVVQHGPYGPEAQLIGSTDDLTDQAGRPGQDPRFDYTPRSHSAPWPKGVEQSTQPEAVARQLEQSASIHASATGGSKKLDYAMTAQQDTWVDFYTVDHGSSLQDPLMSGQLKTAAADFGTTDRVSSFARQNKYGYDAAHFHRRYAIGSVPGNYLWLNAVGRPMIKSQAGPARPPIGEASPFTGQDVGRYYDVQGAVLTDPAVEYTPPVEPYLAPNYGQAAEPSTVAWW